jgi:putative transposase
MSDDCDYSVCWQMHKTQFTRQYRHQNSGLKRSKIWQPRYWEHMIRSQDDLYRHIDYIHYNPVKHGLVISVKDWRYSSFNKFYMRGYYEKGWGDIEPNSVIDMCYE